MTNHQTDSVSRESGWTFWIVFSTAVSFLIIPATVYSTVSVNAPSEIIKQFMNETEMGRKGQPLPQSSLNSFYGLLVAVGGLGGTASSLTANSIADRLGRKYSIYIANLTGCVGMLLMVLCSVCSSYEMLFVGRIIMGISSGWGFNFVPTYNMEMCLPHQRGAVAMAFTILQSLSILVAQVIGFEELLGNKECWLYLIGLPLVLLIIQLILLPFCPQNPRYLLMKRNDEAGAIKVLQIIRGRTDVTDNIKQIREEMADSANQSQIPIYKLFLSSTTRRLLFVAAVMGLYLSFNGLNVILFFSGTMFRNVGVADKSSRYAIAATGGVFLVSNIVAALLLPHFKRKTLFVAGASAMSVLTAVFALISVFQEQVDFLKYVSVVVMSLSVAAVLLGPVSVYWVILGEMFPHNARGSGFAVSIFFLFASFFLQCYALPAMISTMTSYTSFFFSGVNAAMVVFCIFFIPETKGRTFEEISESWTKTKNVGSNLQSSIFTNLTESQSNIQKNSQENGVYIVNVTDLEVEDKGSNHIKEIKTNYICTRL